MLTLLKDDFKVNIYILPVVLVKRTTHDIYEWAVKREKIDYFRNKCSCKLAAYIRVFIAQVLKEQTNGGEKCAQCKQKKKLLQYTTINCSHVYIH